MQVDTSLVGSSLPPLASNPHSIELAVDSVSSLGSHPMITRAKAGIFKTRHPVNLGVLRSSGLLSVLLTSTEPKGFKSTAKNPAWLAAMDEEVQALQQNGTWIWSLGLSTLTSWALNGCFALNIFRMDPSSVSRLALLLKVIVDPQFCPFSTCL